MDWNKDKTAITEFYFAAINSNNQELFKAIGQHREKAEPLYYFIEFIIERLTAVTTLVLADMFWDAEIVLRSALETFVKFLYITSADKEDGLALLKEYWKDFDEIHRLKLSDQAKRNLKHLHDSPLHKIAYSPLLLSEEEEVALRLKWTKSKRQQLENKWSFSQIINHISKTNAGNPLQSFEVLSHSYRMASHVAHGDQNGLLIILERNSRPVDQKEASNIAHFLRLLSDSYYYSMWTAISTMSYLNLSPKYFVDLYQSFKEIHVMTDQYHNMPFADNSYDKFRE